MGYSIEDCPPLVVATKYESEVSWAIDMDSAVRDTQYAISEILMN